MISPSFGALRSFMPLGLETGTNTTAQQTADTPTDARPGDNTTTRLNNTVFRLFGKE